jgi:hypothetical protein
MRNYQLMGAGETTEGPHIVYRETRSGVSGNCREQSHPEVNVITIYSSPIARAGNEQALHKLFLDALDGLNCLDSGGTFELNNRGTSFAASS